jgi:hypothetical protein
VECSGNGQCDINGVCTCHNGFKGEACNEATCREPCFNEGTCTKDLKCACKPGFAGDRCEVKLCPQNCHGRGRCNGNGECICNKGWKGATCDHKTCATDPVSHLECYDNGVCQKDGHCRCLPGFAGEACQTLLCPNNCNMHNRQGECLANKCECYPGFAGVDCSVRLLGVPRKAVAAGTAANAKEPDDNGICGEDCDQKCEKDSNCVIHTEQLFTFETLQGQTYKITVPITRGTGTTFSHWVKSQHDAKGKPMPEISKTAETDRVCFLRCLRNCKRRCFEDLHRMTADARNIVIKEKDLAHTMPGITGNLVADLAAAAGAGGNSTDNNVALLAGLKNKASSGEGGSEDASKAASAADEDASTKATLAQVSNAVQEDPVIKNPDGSITEVTTKAPGPANATRGNETVNFTSNATSNASALEAAPVSLDAATANVSRR